MNKKLGKNTKGVSGAVIAVVVIVIIIAAGCAAYYLLNTSSQNNINSGGNDGGGGSTVTVEGKLATNTTFTYDCYIGGILQGSSQIKATITGESGNNYIIQLSGNGTGISNPLNFNGVPHTYTLLMDKGTGNITLQSSSVSGWHYSLAGGNAVRLYSTNEAQSLTLNVGSSATMGMYITNIVVDSVITESTYSLLLSSSNIIYK